MRYERQILVKQIGEKGQEILAKSKVTVIGCGGLASPLLTYLVCAGIGTITFVDFDTVTDSNLNRQFIYHEDDIGKSKPQTAEKILRELNSEIVLNSKYEKATQENICDLIKESDIVIDCVDNVETRMIVNRACIQLAIPLVEGGVNGFYGFVLSINQNSPCLECIGYENTKLKKPGANIGAVVGVIGSLQAVECIKILLGLDGILYGKMLNYDGLSTSFETIELQKDDMCGTHKSLR